MRVANSVRRFLVGCAAVLLASAPPGARAAPTSVTVAGSLESELGCPGDWTQDCAAAHLVYDANDDVWQNTWTLPAGTYEYKAALDDSWNENYGAHAVPGGANIPLNLAADTSVKFYYSDATHWITDSVNSVIASVVGSFQSELGCSGDWSETCLRGWLQDLDGDGIYTFETTALPPGSYEVKVVIDESWAVNYGAGGVQDGPNIPFTVGSSGQLVRFRYDATSHVLTTGHGHDDNVEWNGLAHDSQDLAWRTPFGAVVAGTEVTLRFRTFHDDVTGVKLRVWDAAAAKETFTAMQIVATGDCLSASLSTEQCDWWEARLKPETPTTLWYRFVVQDGTAVAYYADDAQLDGGWGETTPSMIDNSYAVTVYAAGFQPVSWLRDAVVYQIFPDRFANGNRGNDPSTSEFRYGYPPNPLDQIIRKAWSELPEGYCRSYVAVPCDDDEPRGRDYFGGDLKGIDQRLEQVRALGVTALYLNPIFESASNHGYDTRDYLRIDHRFGTQRDWEKLESHARALGMRIILDGVFNHVSSDSPYFDADHHYAAVGACEDVASPYRSWFTFTGTGTCAGGQGYVSWFGFGSLPVLDKGNVDVRRLFFAGPDPVATHWLAAGADGWRLDVMSDASFPPQFWRDFRGVVKARYPQAPIIAEAWRKGDVLPMVRGDTADTTMNYRFRNAVTAFLGQTDNKGFPDDNRERLGASRLANHLLSMREDYPDATWFTSLNLLDSHDTERILWSLAPGARNAGDKENPANLEIAKARLRLAVLLQMTLPGAPTIYYGDEVGLTGGDDPDCRRTMPWAPSGQPAGDGSLRAWYQRLALIRAANPVLRRGDLQLLVADDAARVFAFSRAQGNALAIVAVNGDEGSSQAGTVPLEGVARKGVRFIDLLSGARTVSSELGVSLTLEAGGAALLVAEPGQDLTGPGAPRDLSVTAEGNETVQLGWRAVSGAAGYHVYRSFLAGGGGETLVTSAPVGGTAFTDGGLANGQPFYYVVTAVDALGNEGPASAEVVGVPHLVIGWANLQWPPTMTHTISILNRTDTAYGQVWIDGATIQPGATPTLRAQLGFGPVGSMPTEPSWSWVDASFNTDSGNNDEFKASLLPEAVGAFDYLFRYTTDAGRTWVHADLNGPVAAGAFPPNPGKLSVVSSGDTTAPSTPTGLTVVSATPVAVELAWDSIAGDASLYGYEVLRAAGAGDFAVVALVTASAFTDVDVVPLGTYHYEVRAVDQSFNRSSPTDPVTAIAQLRNVTITVNVTVPADTDATGRTVYIAGDLDQLGSTYPNWNPAGVAMARLDATHWTTTLEGPEGVNLQYKYALGDWLYVEKDASCGEIGNRMLTVTYGTTGDQVVNDTVLNWRSVAPCGN